MKLQSNGIDWIAGIVLNGLLPIYEAAERIKSPNTSEASNVVTAEPLPSKLGKRSLPQRAPHTKPGPKPVSAEVKYARAAKRRAQQIVAQRAYRKRKAALERSEQC